MALTISITAYVTVLFMGFVLIDQPEKVYADIIVSLPIIEEGIITFITKLHILLHGSILICSNLGHNCFTIKRLRY